MGIHNIGVHLPRDSLYKTYLCSFRTWSNFIFDTMSPLTKTKSFLRKDCKKRVTNSNYNNKKKLKKCWSSIQSSSSIAHKQMITCNNNAFVPVCQFLEEHRLETSNLQKQWFSHHMDFLSLSTLIDCQKRQAKTNHCCWNRNYNTNTHNLDNKKCKC